MSFFLWASYGVSFVSANLTEIFLIIPPPNEVGWGYVYWIHLVCLSVCLSVCRQHGFQSLLWNFNFKFHVHVDCGHRQKSPLFFSNVSFKMATWWPYWIFWFPDSVWLWISTPSFSSKILVYMCRSLLIFSDSHFQNGCLAAILDFSFVYSVGGMVSGA